MNEQRRILNTAKEDAELLSSKDEMTLSDQSGKQVDLPKAERQSIILAMRNKAKPGRRVPDSRRNSGIPRSGEPPALPVKTNCIGKV